MDELDLGQTIRGFAAGQKILNRYTFIRILGRGGMGVVWLAHDDDLEREVALKFLPELVVHDRAVLDDLKRETRRSLALTHHNIVRIYDFAQGPECACISMEYVDGATLSSLRIDQPDKVFEVETLGPLMEQVCSALQYAHVQARIVHRDLKPSNLMMNARGDVKVADFGIARSLTDSVSMLTMARGTSGTLVYMSPQQLDGERASELDDIYSLGATIYELLTGKPPFFSGQIDRLVREKTPPMMTARRADLGVTSKLTIPPHWEETIAACLAKDPAARPQSALELKDRLLSAARPPIIQLASPATSAAAAVSASTASSTQPEASWKRRHPGILIALVAGLIVAGVAAILIGEWVLSREKPLAPEPQVSPAPSIVPFTSPPVRSASPAMSPSPTIAVVLPQPPPPEPASTASVQNELGISERIKQFVAEHFRKTERTDCDGILADYANRVDYFDNGVVEKSFIARECSAYVKAWPEIKLQITEAIQVWKSRDDEYTVSFGYDFDERNRAKGKISRGHAADQWRVESHSGEFRITYHREKITKRSGQ